jgi:hypothetical protein
MRQREAKLGTTVDSRFMIRVRWIDPNEAAADDATISPIRKIG